jgi:hypothetical protein
MCGKWRPARAKSALLPVACDGTLPKCVTDVRSTLDAKTLAHAEASHTLDNACYQKVQRWLRDQKQDAQQKEAQALGLPAPPPPLPHQSRSEPVRLSETAQSVAILCDQCGQPVSPHHPFWAHRTTAHVNSCPTCPGCRMPRIPGSMAETAAMVMEAAPNLPDRFDEGQQAPRPHEHALKDLTLASLPLEARQRLEQHGCGDPREMFALLDAAQDGRCTPTGRIVADALAQALPPRGARPPLQVHWRRLHK